MSLWDQIEPPKGAYFDEDTADRAIFFIENFCTHVKGEWARQPLLMEDWQKLFIGELFGTKREVDGLRQYVNAWLEIARKNTKSTMIAAIGLYGMVGESPVEEGAEIYCGAADKTQANIVFEIASGMVDQDEKLSELLTVHLKSIYYRKRKSVFKSLTRSAETKHGLNSYINLIDEVHAHKTKELINVLTTGTGSRKEPLNLHITTAGVKKKGLAGWDLHEYARKVAEGVIDDPTWLVKIYGLDENDDPFDENNWPKANPCLGVSKKMSYMRAQATKAKNEPSYLNTFKQLDLNIWTGASEVYITPQDWDKCAGEPQMEEGQDVIIPLDLASVSDLTALQPVFREQTEEGDIFSTLTYSFLPEDYNRDRGNTELIDLWIKQGVITTTPGTTTDYSYVKSKIIEIAETYNILEIVYDPYNANQLIKELEEMGLLCVEHQQGWKSMSPALKEVERAIMQGRLRHGGNPCLAWQCSNMLVKRDESDNIRPDKKNSGDKIDNMVALTMGVGRWVFGHKEGKKQSIYNTRKPRVL